MLYILISSLYRLRFSDSVFWFLGGAILMFIFMALILRFFILKDEFNNTNQPPVKRILVLTYTAIALLGISFIYGRWRLHSIPEGERAYKEFQASQSKALKP
ncbi:hypothetical protein [Rudanella paleaurantiibacter]|nr:hypothetical protein [Rudanella paleaurantiibacter]